MHKARTYFPTSCVFVKHNKYFYYLSQTELFVPTLFTFINREILDQIHQPLNYVIIITLKLQQAKSLDINFNRKTKLIFHSKI